MVRVDVHKSWFFLAMAALTGSGWPCIKLNGFWSRVWKGEKSALAGVNAAYISRKISMNAIFFRLVICIGRTDSGYNYYCIKNPGNEPSPGFFMLLYFSVNGRDTAIFIQPENYFRLEK